MACCCSGSGHGRGRSRWIGSRHVLGFILIYSSGFDDFLLVMAAFCTEFEFYLNWVSKILFISIHRNGMGCV